jgi:hypothetical protein
MRFITDAIVIACIVVIAACSGTGCATITPEILSVRSHDKYKTLDKESEKLIENIMQKAIRSDRRAYYFSKLHVLLNTPVEASSSTKVMNEKYATQSVREVQRTRRYIASQTSNDGLQKYLNKEEIYELKRAWVWSKYCPFWHSSCFYVSCEDVTDILVHIKVKINGNTAAVERIIEMEDAIEKHLSKPGFSVNLVLVGTSGPDVFEVKADMTQWPTSYNWSGGYKTLAHELMHLMGLPDEYDRIESHASNKNMTIKQRLQQFSYQMDDELPADANKGIMCYSWLKPLERHVCAAVGLGDKCVKSRKEKFEKKCGKSTCDVR